MVPKTVIPGDTEMGAILVEPQFKYITYITFLKIQNSNNKLNFI